MGTLVLSASVSYYSGEDVYAPEHYSFDTAKLPVGIMPNLHHKFETPKFFLKNDINCRKGNYPPQIFITREMFMPQNTIILRSP
jgi:hypothetical protein